MNYCYYATHNPHGHLDYSDSSGTDSETASASASASSSSSSSSSFFSPSSTTPILPRRMNLLDLAMIKLINTGGSAKVYLVLDKIQHHRPLALKVIPKSKPLLFHISNREKVTEEKVIHSFLTMEGDDFFLPLVATWSDRENFYLASEYVPGGDLALRIMQQRTFDEAEARFYIAELIVALEHLHAHKIIHRDIKPSNILIRPDGHILLADFGISKRFDAEDSFETSTDSDEISSHYNSAVQEEFHRLAVGSDSGEADYMTSDDCGTPYFMSPEQHRRDKYSFEVDYWAVGVILYRMVTGRMPFGDCAMHKGQIARSVLEDDVSFAGTTISMVTQDFILGLLAKDTSHRLHPSHIRTDPFFYGINWAQVETRQLPAPWHPYIAPIPKHSRAIFAGYREELVDSPSCLNDPIASFTWYSSPYHARLRPPCSPHPHPHRNGKKSAKPGTNPIPLSWKWKSWIQSVVFCARDGKKASSRTRRRKGQTKGRIAI